MAEEPFPDNAFLEMVKKYKADKEKQEQYEKAQLESPDPKTRISKKINKMFNDFENTVCSKMNKMKYYIDQDIWGYPGASRIKEFDPVEINEAVTRMVDRFEKELGLEMEKIKIAKKDILEDIKKMINE